MERLLLFENIAMAYSAIKSNKMRSLLTMLGIIIGIGSVIAIKTVGASLSKSVTDTMQTVGASNITVGVTQRSTATTKNESGFEFTGPKRKRQTTEDDLITQDMIDDLLLEFPDDIDYVSLSRNLGEGTITIEGMSVNVTVSGGNEGYFKERDLEILAGDDIGDKAINGAKSVCLISDFVAKKFFGADEFEKALGQSMEVIIGQKFYDYTVVGIYKYNNNGSLFGGDEDPVTGLYVPGSSIASKTHIEGYASFTVVKNAETTKTTDQLIREISTFFDRYYHSNKNFEVTASSMESLMDALSGITDKVSTAISIVAGISLIVGGIGVMNIMLVSISERTREIGTRKALGATNSSIRIQFIVEAMMLCLIGGAIGIAIGVAGGSFAATKLGYSASADVSSIVGSVIFSLAIGVFFGYYPANKAAKMNPIDALRYE